MSEIKTQLVPCNGRLSNFFNVELRTRIDKEEFDYNVNVRLKLVRTSQSEEAMIRLIQKQTIFSIYLDGELLESRAMDLDFKSYNQVMIEQSYKIANEETLAFDIEGVIEFTDEAHYLSNTGISDRVILLPFKEKKLFVEISGIDRGESILVQVSKNIEPDYLQFKTNHQDWTKFSGDSVGIPKIEGNQYIQVRGKKEDYFSNSNTIKVIDGIIIQ